MSRMRRLLISSIVVLVFLLLIIPLAGTTPVSSHLAPTLLPTRHAPAIIAMTKIEAPAPAEAARPDNLGAYSYGIPRAEYLVWLDDVTRNRAYDNRPYRATLKSRVRGRWIIRTVF